MQLFQSRVRLVKFHTKLGDWLFQRFINLNVALFQSGGFITRTIGSFIKKGPAKATDRTLEGTVQRQN